MATVTTSTEGELLKQYWKEKFLTELRSNLVLYDLGMKGQVPNGQGTVCWWLSLADLSAAASLSVEGAENTESSYSAGKQSAALTQYGDYVKISDVLQETVIDGAVDQMVEKLARGAAVTQDNIIMAVMSAGGTAQYAGSAVARNSIASDSHFNFDIAEAREAVRTLEKANVAAHPMATDGGKYVGIIGPDAKFDLVGDSAWRETVIYNESGQSKLKGNIVGTNYGVSFMETTEVLTLSNSGSASQDVIQTFIMGDEAVGVSEFHGLEMITKNPAPESPLDLYGNFGYKFSVAVKELDATRCIRVESTATGLS